MKNGWLAALALVACGAPSHAPSSAPPSASADPARATPESIGASPDAKSLAALAAQLDTTCVDSCCLLAPNWTSDLARPPSLDEKKAARKVLADDGARNDARVVALALRILSHAADKEDALALVNFVSDVRPAGMLPFVHVGQAMMRCYPVSWEPSTPSREALAALSSIYGMGFESVARFREFQKAHPDPELDLEVWLARFAQRTPPEPSLVDALRARGPELFVDVMLVRCENPEELASLDGSCGIADAELAIELKKWGKSRALDLLEATSADGFESDRLRAAESTILRLGHRVFDSADIPRLEEMWKTQRFGPAPAQAQLAVLLSRLRPGEATKYWQRTLGEMDERGAAIILREAAKIDPIAMQPSLLAWFFADPTKARADASNGARTGEAILRGLSEETDTRGKKTFAKLIASSWQSTEASAMESLASAALHFGCAGIPAPRDVRAHPGKNAAPDAIAREDTRAKEAVDALIRNAKSCARTL